MKYKTVMLVYEDGTLYSFATTRLTVENGMLHASHVVCDLSNVVAIRVYYNGKLYHAGREVTDAGVCWQCGGILMLHAHGVECNHCGHDFAEPELFRMYQHELRMKALATK